MERVLWHFQMSCGFPLIPDSVRPLQDADNTSRPAGKVSLTQARSLAFSKAESVLGWLFAGDPVTAWPDRADAAWLVLLVVVTVRVYRLPGGRQARLNSPRSLLTRSPVALC